MKVREEAYGLSQGWEDLASVYGPPTDFLLVGGLGSLKIAAADPGHEATESGTCFFDGGTRSRALSGGFKKGGPFFVDRLRRRGWGGRNSGDSYRCYNCNSYKYEDLFGWRSADAERWENWEGEIGGPCDNFAAFFTKIISRYKSIN